MYLVYYRITVSGPIMVVLWRIADYSTRNALPFSGNLRPFLPLRLTESTRNVLSLCGQPHTTLASEDVNFSV